MIAAAKQTSRQLEDALAYLPRKGEVGYRRGQVIYDEQNPSNGLSLVVEGRVKVTTATEDGSQIVAGLFCADEFFGAFLLLGQHTSREQAVALEITTLMSWPRTEIEAQIERQPNLGVALMQMLAMRCLDLEERLQSLALDTTLERLAVSLLRFARLGTRERDGAVSIPPLTHQLLSGYLGTSREIVTGYMNQLRRQGFVRYSRKAIEIYPEALTEYLRNQHD
jgi:CRP/FNR family cyclic AMP-dependent transcriptional regulator